MAGQEKKVFEKKERTNREQLGEATFFRALALVGKSPQLLKERRKTN